jgi:hypothetical protein
MAICKKAGGLLSEFLSKTTYIIVFDVNCQFGPKAAITKVEAGVCVDHDNGRESDMRLPTNPLPGLVRYELGSRDEKDD